MDLSKCVTFGELNPFGGFTWKNYYDIRGTSISGGGGPSQYHTSLVNPNDVIYFINADDQMTSTVLHIYGFDINVDEPTKFGFYCNLNADESSWVNVQGTTTQSIFNLIFHPYSTSYSDEYFSNLFSISLVRENLDPNGTYVGGSLGMITIYAASPSDILVYVDDLLTGTRRFLYKDVI